MSRVYEQHLFTRDVQKLVAYAADELGLFVTYGEAWRTPEQQAIYVKDGRSKTMKSRHLDRLAVDFNFFRGAELVTDYETFEKLGRFWQGLSPQNRWGGNFDGDWNPATGFKDWPHFERNA